MAAALLGRAGAMIVPVPERARTKLERVPAESCELASRCSANPSTFFLAFASIVVERCVRVRSRLPGNRRRQASAHPEAQPTIDKILLKGHARWHP